MDNPQLPAKSPGPDDLMQLLQERLPLNTPLVRALTWGNVMATPSIGHIVREYGESQLIYHLGKVLEQADDMCGGHNSGDAIMGWVMMIIDTYKNRSIGMILLAIRRGLSSGKVFGKLTYPQIAEWINEGIEAGIGMNDKNHGRNGAR